MYYAKFIEIVQKSNCECILFTVLLIINQLSFHYITVYLYVFFSATTFVVK